MFWCSRPGFQFALVLLGLRAQTCAGTRPDLDDSVGRRVAALTQGQGVHEFLPKDASQRPRLSADAVEAGQPASLLSSRASHSKFGEADGRQLLSERAVHHQGKPHVEGSLSMGERWKQSVMGKDVSHEVEMRRIKEAREAAEKGDRGTSWTNLTDTLDDLVTKTHKLEIDIHEDEHNLGIAKDALNKSEVEMVALKATIVNQTTQTTELQAKVDHEKTEINEMFKVTGKMSNILNGKEAGEGMTPSGAKGGVDGIHSGDAHGDSTHDSSSPSHKANHGDAHGDSTHDSLSPSQKGGVDGIHSGDAHGASTHDSSSPSHKAHSDVAEVSKGCTWKKCTKAGTEAVRYVGTGGDCEEQAKKKGYNASDPQPATANKDGKHVIVNPVHCEGPDAAKGCGDGPGKGLDFWKNDIPTDKGEGSSDCYFGFAVGEASELPVSAASKVEKDMEALEAAKNQFVKAEQASSQHGSGHGDDDVHGTGGVNAKAVKSASVDTATGLGPCTPNPDTDIKVECFCKSEKCTVGKFCYDDKCSPAKKAWFAAGKQTNTGDTDDSTEPPPPPDTDAADDDTPSPNKSAESAV